MRCVADVPWIMDHGPWILGYAAKDSAVLRGELCALPATHIAERCCLAALKLPRLTHDLLNMSESVTALRVDPLFEGCRSRYETRLSAKVAFATLFYLGSRAVVTVLLSGVGTLIPGPWTLDLRSCVADLGCRTSGLPPQILRTGPCSLAQCNRRASQRS